jgi:uncharacterized membrane protein HdeD (DUF308 family)
MADGVLADMARGWWVLVVWGVVAVLFGIGTFIWPLGSVIALVLATGILALAEGLTSLFALFSKDVVISKGWLTLYAIASIAFGLVALFRPLATAGAMLLLLAAWLLVAGVMRIVFAIRLRKEIQGEWLLALSGVLAIVLGWLFIAAPGVGILTMALWIGAGALIYGILQIWVGFRLRKLGTFGAALR